VKQTVRLEADGVYQFAELIPSTYTIRIDEASLPDRLFITFNVDGSGEFTTTVALSPGTDVQNIEFGLVGAF
jgi:hypothetical protein